MDRIDIPYGRRTLPFNLENRNVKAVLRQNIHLADADPGIQRDIVRTALENPVACQRLSRIARKASRLLVITSDHTRPVPSRLTLPLLLAEAREKNPGLEVKILVATGLHRASTPAEMEEKFGRELLASEDFIMHDCRASGMTFKGTLPSGGELWLNPLVDWADLVVSEGFIEPHFFAGFSGGRKSVLPGIASEKTVCGNHCADFIASERSRTGNLLDNPIHKDMLFAADAAGLKFILNVVIDQEKNILSAYAGDPTEAHLEGCGYVSEMARVDPVEGDIVITSNNGYPLDQNIYQAVKSMTAAEACVRPGGVIICCAECEDGHGGEWFYRYFAGAKSPREVVERISSVPQNETGIDQWEAQVLARVLVKARVILVSGLGRELVEDMHLTYAENLDEAYKMALTIVEPQAETVIIPDGVGVIVKA